MLPILFTACAEEKIDSENHSEVIEVAIKDTVSAIVIASPLVVTPEFWENFATDISMVVFFTGKEDLSDHQDEILSSVEEQVSFIGVGYHQVFSSDSSSFVFLNDSLMFDFTEYKHQFSEGYFLLKPREMPDVFGFVDDMKTIEERIKTYYQ